MAIVLFEDDRVGQLSPITLGKPAFSITCGSYRLLDLVNSLDQAVHLLVRPHLRPLLEADGLRVGLPETPASGPLLLVNARLVPSVSILEKLREVLRSGKPGAVRQGGVLALAQLPPAATLPPEISSILSLSQFLESMRLAPLDLELPLLDYPHDIVRHHLTTMRPNLEHRLATGTYREVADGVFAAEGARLGQYIVTNTTAGPILLDRDASIGPYCYLSGPAYLGASARVIEHSALKDGVSLGHTTKIGGEVEGSVIEPYTNKQHHGFLGHSYLGSWVNLGAGTCNSDLKNTYGNVNMDYHGQKIPTGMQFIGSLVGDYAKTAINTGIFTGKTIGACSMVYGFVTTNVPSFVNYARSFGQVTEAPVEVMVATQARMFARRKVVQRPCDIQLIQDMYELTRHERQLAGEPLSL
jgi:UDP-N-acetylglucosamine diphosphorylase/glucosamine-1-phosphate N-acetyltransferase